MIDKALPGNGAITSGVYQGQISDILDRAEPDIEVDVAPDDDEAANTTVVIDIVDPADEHDSNLLETVFKDPAKRAKVETLCSDLIAQYEEDKRSRDPWYETYRKGLDLLGLHMEERTDPWEGASGVVHPLLTEAVVRFQSEAITETFPAFGPVKVQIIGKQTPERTQAADRVKDDMNWRLTEEMPEYRVEHERVLWNLPIAGSAFKKVYYDASRGRQAAMFVPADNVVVNYGAADMHDAERVTHVMHKSKNWIERMIANGTYVDEDLGQPVRIADENQEAKDKLVGEDGSNSEMYEVLEMLVNLSVESDEEDQEFDYPYVVTINKSTTKFMAIRRNWDKDDELKIKLNHFVHYTYITGFGFYGFGLIHLVGGHAKAGTSLLRQLIDAGTLANLPGGFKTRGMRIKDDQTPHRPGEFKDADIPSGTLKDNIMTLPYKEPSGTLFQLLQSVVEDGRKAANISDASFSDANQNAPVGTTLALIERQLKTLSAVQSRVHAAMRIEFKMIKQLVRDNGERSYPYEADPDKMTKDADYDCTDIIPVSDPNATTMGVRIAQFQAAFELSGKAPQLYDQAFLHREMLTTLGLKNVEQIVPIPEDQMPRDPVAENMAVLLSKPIKAFVQQDHQSHILVHQAFMNDPKIGMLLGQNPNAQVMFNSLQAHIAEHAAYMYRDQIQKAMGVQLPDPNAQMDPQTEFQLAGLLAQAANQVATQNKNDQAQAQAQQQQQDPLVQMQQAELQLKDREVKVSEDKQLLARQIAQAEGKLGQQNQAPDPVQNVKAQAMQAAAQHDMMLKQQQAAQQGQAAQIQQALQVQQAAAAEKRAQEQHDHGLFVKHAQAVNQETRAERAHQHQLKIAADKAAREAKIAAKTTPKGTK